MMKKIFLLLITILELWGAQEVANITALRGEAVVENGSKKLKAKLGDAIFEKDVVSTMQNSKMQMIFKDETVVTIGKNSVFSVEEYLFDAQKEPEVKFGMIQGAMRTITGKVGKIAPQKFKVETKTATIGIRGTNFTVNVAQNGDLDTYCSYGAIEVSYNGRNYFVEHGYRIHIGASSVGQVNVKPYTPKELKELKKTYFGLKDPEKSTSAPHDSATNVVAEDTGTELDVTVEDQSDSLLALLDEENSNNVQNVSDLASLIASYSMSNASYSGTFSGTDAVGNAESGTAFLDIDFGAKSINLSLETVNSGQGQLFSINPQFNGVTFTVEGQDLGYGVPTATGTFQEPTGNTVTGDYTIPDTGGTAQGTYSVTTSQTLY